MKKDIISVILSVTLLAFILLSCSDDEFVGPDPVPEKPLLISPVDSFLTKNLTPEFDWSDAKGAEYYTLQLDIYPDFNDPEIIDSITASLYTHESPLDTGTYFWKVSASNSSGSSGFTEYRRIYLGMDPTAPSGLFEPADGSMLTDNTPFFNWPDVPDIKSYLIMIDNNSDFSSPEYIEYISSSEYTSPELEEGTYYWFVSSVNDFGQSSGSPVINFTIGHIPYSVPMQVQPADTVLTSDITPYFEWTEVPDAASYNLMVDNDQDFSSPEIEISIPVNSYTANTKLDFNTYYWKVSATNDFGSTLFSDPWTFRVQVPDEMVFVEGGTFLMGDHYNEGYSNELPLHDVTVSSFYIAKYEVTQKEYFDIMGDNPTEISSFGAGDNYPVYYINWYWLIEYCNKRSLSEGLTPCYSLNGSTDMSDWGVTPYFDYAIQDTVGVPAVWDKIQCNWSADGYRLPTEAEWEYAARGGVHSDDNYRYSGCLYETQLQNFCWYSYNSLGKTHPVGTKSPNQLGIYDMNGNVWEYCWDWYDENYYSTCYSEGTVENPHGPDTGTYRIRRGGHWNLDSRYNRIPVRAFSQMIYNAYNYLGFRVVRTP